MGCCPCTSVSVARTYTALYAEEKKELLRLTTSLNPLKKLLAMPAIGSVLDASGGGGKKEEMLDSPAHFQGCRIRNRWGLTFAWRVRVSVQTQQGHQHGAN